MHLLPVILDSIGLGLILSILAGPVFLTIINTSLERGVRAAAVLSSGQWLSDAIIITLVFFSTNLMSGIQQYKLPLGLAGASMLTIMGGSLIFSKPLENDPESPKSKRLHLTGLFIKGFAMNTLNPFPIIFWLTLAGQGVAQGFTKTQLIVQFATVLGIVVLTDLLKARLANTLRPYLKPSTMTRWRKISGAGLVIFGIILAVRVLFY